MKKKIITVIGISLSILIVVTSTRYFSLMSAYNKEINGDISYNYKITQHPFYSGSQTIDFISDGEHKVTFSVWSRAISGSTDITIVDVDGNVYAEMTYTNDKAEKSVLLPKGKFELLIKSNSYTGAFCLSCNELITVNTFPNDRYQIISSKDIDGSEWDYILYVPEEIKYKKLLIVPNNTGIESDSILIHTQKAIDLSTWLQDFADHLGTPMLMPVFPRPSSHPEQYTHALNRAALLSQDEGLHRLDLQLIAMILHSKGLLNSKGINLDEKNIMFGFSAAGDFVDRFSILHPELIEAVALGGSDNILPINEYNDIPLPYPLGTYDYESIAGKPFDQVQFSTIKRMIFKGSLDEGGWMTVNNDMGTIVYTGEEYYDQFISPEIKNRIKGTDTSINIEEEITQETLENLSYLAFDGDTFVDLYKRIEKIYKDNNYENHNFYIYNDVGHEIPKEIREDVLKFFMELQNKN